MNCIYCSETLPVPECITALIVGKISELSPVHLFVKNITTGFTHIEEVTSGIDGTITLDTTLPDKSFYNENHLYEIWATGIADLVRLPITINLLQYDCLMVSFEKIIDSPYTTFEINI